MCMSSLISKRSFSWDLIFNYFLPHICLLQVFYVQEHVQPYYWFWLNYLQSFKTDLLGKSQMQCVGNLLQFQEILHLCAPVVKCELKSFLCVLSLAFLLFLLIKLLMTHFPSGHRLLSSQSWRKVRKRKMEYEGNI